MVDEVGKQYRIFSVEHDAAATIRVVRGQFNTTAPSSHTHRNHVQISMYETICIIVDRVYDNFRSQTATWCDIALTFSSPFSFRFFSFSTYQFLCRPSRKSPVTAPTPVLHSLSLFTPSTYMRPHPVRILLREISPPERKRNIKKLIAFSPFIFSRRARVQYDCMYDDVVDYGGVKKKKNKHKIPNKHLYGNPGR